MGGFGGSQKCQTADWSGKTRAAEPLAATSDAACPRARPLRPDGAAPGGCAVVLNGAASCPQGIDLKAGGRNKRVHRSAPKSDNPYVKLLVKVRSGAAWVGRPAGPHAALLALAAAGAWQGDREAWQPRRGLQRGWLRANWSDMRRGCS